MSVVEGPDVMLAGAIEHMNEKSSSNDQPDIERLEEVEDNDDPDLVTFDEHDPANPYEWSALRRWSMVTAVATMSMISVLGTTIIVPAAPQIMSDFHVRHAFYSTLLVSIWELGEGIGPFFVGPLSERFGRLPVFHTGNVLGLLCSVASALSTNISMLVAFRFLNGAFLTGGTLNPAIVGDVVPPESRGLAMAIGGGFQLIGPVIAPICGAFIANGAGWRWTIWVTAIAIGSCGTYCLLVLRESYAVKILQRKAARLRRETGNPRLHSKQQVHWDASSVLQSVTRPAQLFFRSYTVFLTSVYTGVAYALSYTVLTTLTEIMETQYGFGHGTVGLAFLPRSIGSIIALAFYGLTSDRYLKHKKAQSADGKFKPEDRLICMWLGAIVLPPAFIVYGWTLQYHVQWIVPLIAVAFIDFGKLLAIVATENYLVDAHEIYSASAMAAGNITRAFFAAGLPLIGPPLYRNLGLGWGNSLLALISAIFIPFLYLMTRKDRKARQDTQPSASET